MAVKIKKNNARNLNITITEDAIAKDITGWTITLACKRKQGMTNAQAEFVKTATITNAIGGLATVALSSNDTDMPAMVYYCDVKAVDGSGNIQNSTTFKIEITESITL